MGVINPGIPTTWHEIVELILRAGCTVLCFIIMICAAITLSAVESAQENIDKVNDRFYRNRDGAIEYENKDDYEAAAGWLVFVAVMGMAIEPLLIILRLLNISFVNQYFVIFAIADMVKSGLFVIFLLSGGAASASYSENSADFYDEFEDKCTDKDYNQYDAVEDACNDVKRVGSAQAASAAFSFFGMVAFGALAGIMVVNLLFRGRTAGAGKTEGGSSD